MNDTPYEIERKFLIRMPDSALLAGAEASRITQTYLVPEEGASSDRVRRRDYGDRTVYTHTVKTHVSDMRRVEIETEIDRDGYEQLLLRADPDRRPIEKTRYCLKLNGLVYEIDVFPFWTRQAYMEIELNDENQRFPWPQGVVCLREVTGDRRYTNAALALEIPAEEP